MQCAIGAQFETLLVAVLCNRKGLSLFIANDNGDGWIERIGSNVKCLNVSVCACVKGNSEVIVMILNAIFKCRGKNELK